MTNYEKYKNQIIELTARGNCIGLLNGKIANCNSIHCVHCGFDKMEDCYNARRDWLNAEYIEKPKLTQREWHLCKAIETGWIARNESGLLYRFEEKPSKSGEIWFHPGIMLSLRIVPDCFEFIQWQDEEPWSIEDLLKLEVEG